MLPLEAPRLVLRAGLADAKTLQEAIADQHWIAMQNRHLSIMRNARQ
jgi:hypothetical protein